MNFKKLMVSKEKMGQMDWNSGSHLDSDGFLEK